MIIPNTTISPDFNIDELTEGKLDGNGVFDNSVYFFLVGNIVVVTANNGRHDFGFATEGFVQRHTWADYAFANFGLMVGFFLATNAAKKLVDIMNYAICHE